MESQNELIWEEINSILKQLKENNRGMNNDEAIFKKKMRDINAKIQNASLKATREKLKEEKHLLINDYKNLLYITYVCEKNIQKGLNVLYDKLNDI